ncbi:MAG: hypothetical protein AVDCRST_MAG50-2516 [uncultured Acidimicrobiales bacterium]|uniref:Uncharacterized protein n=1 Tax=uncultured Acidimicrobiales bacterium TaxID=310071 RepID=A0A6J4IE73_9ACTN|nr:MAG: hypothetical protein AVDCRST_MAG50-2516 [uncultured Acidimicrobiales bacterium]
MQRREPSKAWLKVSGAIAVLGLLLGGAWWMYALVQIHNTVKEFERTRFSSMGDVTLDAPGRHTIWFEGSRLSEKGNEPSEYRQFSKLTLTGPDGQPVAFEPAKQERVYNTTAREGRAIWTFDAPSAGTYALRIEFDFSNGWNNIPARNLAVGRGEGLPVRVVRPIALIMGTCFAAAALLAWSTMRRRERTFRRRWAPGVGASS